MQRVMAQHFLHGCKFESAGRLGFVLVQLLFLASFVMDDGFFLRIHKTTSSGFLEKSGKGFAGAMEFASDSIGGLLRQSSNLFVTHLLIGYQEQ
jgi:hypothetical protein